jgi:hypothetical protein
VDIPIGTALGAYSLWVLMRDEAMPMFNPQTPPPSIPAAVVPAG